MHHPPNPGRHLALAALTACGGAAFAQNPVDGTHADALPAVTVRATAQPIDTQPSLPQARAERLRVPGGSDVVDMDSVREGRVSTLQDVLSFSPGVIAQPRFGSEETRLSIRGSALQRTFHLRGILLMQDGIPVTLTDGSGDFQALEPLAARYVDVLRGANAFGVGAATLGGAINYVSPTGVDAPGWQVRGEAGSFGYKREGLQWGGASADGRVDCFASLSGFQQNGYRDHAYQNALRFNGNLGVRLTSAAETRFFLGAARSHSDLPGNLTWAQFKDDPRQAAPANVSGDQQRNIEVLRLANRTTLDLGADSRLELNAFVSHKTLFHPIFQVIEQSSKDWGLGARWVRQAPLAGRPNRLTLGLQWGAGEMDDDRFVNLAGHAGARTNQLHNKARQLTLYAQDEFTLRPDLTVVAGAQAQRSTRDNSDRFIAPGQGDESFSRRYRAFSPRLGLVWDLQPRTPERYAQLYTSLSRSFEPPSFGELTGGLRPNLLNAQRGTTLELGTRGAEGGWTWDVALYHARLSGELLQTQVFPAGNSAAAAPQTVNAGRTIHQGIEAAVGWRPVAALEWRAAWTVNDFRFKDDPVFGNNRLPGLPRQTLRSELLWRGANGLYAGPVLTAAARTDVDMAASTSAAGYVLWGLKAGQRIDRHWSWFVDGRNLANRKYASSVGVVRQATAGTPLYLPGDGRSVYVGLQWTP